VVAFDTTALNVGLADEVAAPPGPDAFLGARVTFSDTSTGLCHSFDIQALEPGAGITFDDNEPSENPAFDAALSIGDIDHFEDDDFRIGLFAGAPIFAVGFFLVDNDPHPRESMVVSLADGSFAVIDGSLLPSSVNGRAFVGFVADVPITQIQFDERPDRNDIGIADLRFSDPSLSDADADSLSDCDEATLTGTDPLDSDSDDDGLADSDEWNVYGTDPLDPDTDHDGLSDYDEIEIFETRPLNSDGDADGLSDGDEVNAHGTNPMNPDTDGDGFDDGREVSEGSDPNYAASTPSPLQPPMFRAVFIMHAFGNDTTTGTHYPYKTNRFYGIPLGHDCAAYTPETSNGAYTKARYCPPGVRQAGAPALGSQVLTYSPTETGSKVALPQSAFGITTTGFMPVYYPYLESHTYATFANASGSFFAGGGPAAGKGVHTRTGVGRRYGQWIINEGANGFGGAMALLGRLGARVQWIYSGRSGIYDANGSWNIIRALGRPIDDTSPTTNGAAQIVNPYTITRTYINSVNDNTSTIMAYATGTPWTTGAVTVYARAGIFQTILHRSGHDMITPGGARNIQLVTPELTHWIGSGFQTHNGHIGILKLWIVPEPRGMLLLAAGLGCLVVLYRVRGRRKR